MSKIRHISIALVILIVLCFSFVLSNDNIMLVMRLGLPIRFIFMNKIDEYHERASFGDDGTDIVLYDLRNISVHDLLDLENVNWNHNSIPEDIKNNVINHSLSLETEFRFIKSINLMYSDGVYWYYEKENSLDYIFCLYDKDGRSLFYLKVNY